ncbi:MAG: GLPGLI family protein [Formosa sp.]|jgi:GLPGLI family protein|nr:GLPGLI family protein [Formosa sp.]MDC0463251.1 GLPGLI family protein [Flavobacteriaceae bacterium]
MRKSGFFYVLSLVFIFLFSTSVGDIQPFQEFQAKAYYFSKSKMELGDWGARLSEAQKKQIAARMRNRLEKGYVLSFNKEESLFVEEDQLDAISGATDSWGKNFTPGTQYKNVKSNTQLQEQEFYGKKFLINDVLQPIEWKLESETKNIGNYTCFKATASIPTKELTWYSFSWDNLRETNNSEIDSTQTKDIKMTLVEAWYTPQIPVRHGPLEYWGLPGLILEVSADNTTMLCSKLVLNPGEIIEIEAPSKGKQVTKLEYRTIINNKMVEFRDNRMRRR